MIRTAVALSLISLIAAPLSAAAPARAPAPATQPAPGGSTVAPGRALAAKLPDVKLNGVALSDAIDFIRDVSGANIHVNWRALELLNVTRQTPVTLQLSSVTTRRVLRSLLDETGAGEMLTFYVDEEVIEVTTKEISDSKLITKVYPVEDLVMTIPDFTNAPTFNLQNQTNQTSGQGGGGGSSGGLFGGNGGGGEQETQVSRQQRANALVTLIMDTVRPEVWRENGGTASVRFFNGHLIVTAPRSVHEQLSVRR